MSGKKAWYSEGLFFSCRGCGRCCSGPEEGYVWVKPEEIKAIGKYLCLSADEVKKEFLYRVGLRYSLIEKQPSKDCIFLATTNKNGDVSKGCEIYPVRPVQCRTWPFWKENVRSLGRWQEAAEVCPGMNSGRLFSCSQINNLLENNLSPLAKGGTDFEEALEWVHNHLDVAGLVDELDALYEDVGQHIEAAGGACENCGGCCNFIEKGHRLYVTTLEWFYFWHGVGKQQGCGKKKSLSFNKKQLDQGICPYYRESLGCTARAWRPVGCRIYYCRDLSGEFQNQLSEQVLRRLHSLHEQFGVPYLYADWLEWCRKGGFFPD